MQKAGRGGELVQLRLKNYSNNEILLATQEAYKICNGSGSKLILNDYPDIARQTEVDGIHLGKKDVAPAEARKLLNNYQLMGGTANTYEDCLHLINEQVDYIGLGPFRFTTTKQKLSPILGLDGYASIMEQLESEGYQIPVYAIGGITIDDITPLINVGIHGVAASSFLTNKSHAELCDTIAEIKDIFSEKFNSYDNV
ncbi:MAG: thiamine phosphate synthase [Bacteroidota bacterium]